AFRRVDLEVRALGLRDGQRLRRALRGGKRLRDLRARGGRGQRGALGEGTVGGDAGAQDRGGGKGRECRVTEAVCGCVRHGHHYGDRSFEQPGRQLGLSWVLQTRGDNPRALRAKGCPALRVGRQLVERGFGGDTRGDQLLTGGAHRREHVAGDFGIRAA